MVAVFLGFSLVIRVLWGILRCRGRGRSSLLGGLCGGMGLRLFRGLMDCLVVFGGRGIEGVRHISLF